jgi:hypothetical protein
MSRTDPVVSETTPGPKLRTEKARQGQNVTGMVTVLGVSIVLVAIAFAAMLAFSAKPADRESGAPPAAAAVSGSQNAAATQQPQQ